MKKLRLLALCLASCPALSLLHADPVWLWKGAEANLDFNKVITLDKVPEKAWLTATADDNLILTINGSKVASSTTYDQPVAINVAKSLKVGENTISVSARNRKDKAGFLFRLEIGDTVVESDKSWKVRTGAKAAWSEPEVVGKYGDEPWGKVFDQSLEYSSTPANEITVRKGFEVELLYSPNKHTEGSWVGMTVDPQGRLITAAQDGAYFRITLGDKIALEKLDLPVSGSGVHGLLYAFDSLYVLVYSKSEKGGLHRLVDTNNDEQFDKHEHLKHFVSGNEHGLHSLVLSPDGQSLYLIAGNSTQLPEGIGESAVPRLWDEDMLLPRMWDPQGNSRGVLAPGGYVIKTDKDGQRWELVSIGYRNPFDAAFNLEGDLFIYDSDMEWDLGLPWYRPTRVSHVVSGSDFGWRAGSGNWPAFHADSLPATLNIGPGSPTGVVSGKGAKFPEHFQRAIFCNDWTSGTMYNINLTADGATYKATSEEFLSGTPLALTEVIIHPLDGNMYFITGGRSTQSGLYRVKYTGSESTEAVAPLPITADAKLRRKLEGYHAGKVENADLDKIWPHLAHPDRFIRTAARIACEKLPVDKWSDKAMSESNPVATIEAIIALARASKEPTLQSKMIDKLLEVDFQKLDKPQKLALLRAFQLVFTRTGAPQAGVREKVAGKLSALFPTHDNTADILMAAILIYLGDPASTAKVVFLMMSIKDDPTELADFNLIKGKERLARRLQQMEESNQSQISLAFALRNAKTGWTPDLYKTYFSWFPHARTWSVGSSAARYLDNCRQEALANVADPALRSSLDKLSAENMKKPARKITPPIGPGQNWTVASALAKVSDKLKGRNFESGKNLYHAAACSVCHAFNGEGGSIGPDLTEVRGRFSISDLLENIVEPSVVISDQYGSTAITKKGGSQLVGKVGAAENGVLQVMTNPYNPEILIEVPVKDIADQKPWPISLMPPGLLNTMNGDEVSDLIAYLLSAGDPKAKYFKKD